MKMPFVCKLKIVYKTELIDYILLIEFTVANHKWINIKLICIFKIASIPRESHENWDQIPIYYRFRNRYAQSRWMYSVNLHRLKIAVIFWVSLIPMDIRKFNNSATNPQEFNSGFYLRFSAPNSHWNHKYARENIAWKCTYCCYCVSILFHLCATV